MEMKAEFNELSKFDRNVLRVSQLAATLSHIVNDELKRHPWKIVFYMPTPFITIPGRMAGFIACNAVYNAVAQTEKAKWARGEVKKCFATEPKVVDFEDCFKLKKDGTYAVNKTKVLDRFWKAFSDDIKDAARFHAEKLKTPMKKSWVSMQASAGVAVEASGLSWAWQKSGMKAGSKSLSKGYQAYVDWFDKRQKENEFFAKVDHVQKHTRNHSIQQKR